MPRIYHSRVAPDATAQGHLGQNYGLTLPIQIVFQIDVKKLGDEWAPVVTAMTGEYCVQARILGHQTDVTAVSIPGVVTQANFQAVLDALNQLGVPALVHNFYSQAAVMAHEEAHANRCRLALENKAADIIAPIEALRVPINTGNGPDRNAGQALTDIQALPAYVAVAGGAYQGTGWNLWFHELLALVAQDHVGEEWCHVAERRITNALVDQINEFVEVQRWRAVPGQIPLPAHLGVQAAHAQIGAVRPVIQHNPVQMPLGALGVAQAQAQLQQPAEVLPVGRPVDLPSGALGVAGAQARFRQAQDADNEQPQLRAVPTKNLPVWPPLPK